MLPKYRPMISRSRDECEMSAHTISFWCRAYVVIQVTNHAPSRPNMNPISGLEMANQNGAASRKRQESCCVVFTLMIFVAFNQTTDRSLFGEASPSNSTRRDS
jgi:hypothetical protein